jgi:hypothetical protein
MIKISKNLRRLSRVFANGLTDRQYAQLFCFYCGGAENVDYGQGPGF